MTRFAFSAMPAFPGASAGGATAGSRLGAIVRGVREAADERALRAALKAEGLIAVDVRPHSALHALRAALASGPGAGGARVRASDAAWFFQTLAMLLKHSVPVEESLGTMEELSPTDRVRGACSRVRESLRAGSALADAVAKVPGLAAPQHLALLRSGQGSGRLDHAVELVNRSMASARELRSALAAGLVYPVILGVASIGVLWLLATFVIPRFAETLESLGGELPWQTSFTLRAAGVLVWGVPIALVALLLGWKSRGAWLTAEARERLAAFTLRTPVIGKLLWNAQGVMACDTMATMIEGGADVLAAVSQAQDVVSNRVIARRLGVAHQKTREGLEIGRAFRENNVLPPTPQAVLQIAVRAGDLPGGLKQAAEVCRQEQARVTQRLLALMGPALILVMAASVGWVVWSLVSGMLALNEVGSSL